MILSIRHLQDENVFPASVHVNEDKLLVNQRSCRVKKLSFRPDISILISPPLHLSEVFIFTSNGKKLQTVAKAHWGFTGETKPKMSITPSRADPHLRVVVIDGGITEEEFGGAAPETGRRDRHEHQLSLN